MTGGALRLARDVVVVRGDDAESFLQGQLSQDVAALEVGAAAFSLLLQPQGKVDAFLRVTRTAPDGFALDVDAGWGETVLARLRRFLLRVKVTLEPVEWPVVAVRGTDVDAPDGAWAVPPETPGVPGVDLIGPAAAAPAGIPAMSPEEYEVLRVATGVPRMGAELGASTIPASAGVVQRAVSFTKGCYTGQELVARIDARGDRVPTRLRRLTVGDGRALAPGDVVQVDGSAVGTVTSAVPGLALAYVRREVEPPAAGAVGGAPVMIEALPA